MNRSREAVAYNSGTEMMHANWVREIKEKERELEVSRH
jgi:hypothetical protein